FVRRMLPRTHRYPLSPYTTLFRSDKSAAPSWMNQDQSSIKLLIDGTSSTTNLVKKKPSGSSENSSSKLDATNQLMQAVIDRSEQDRKSTRLNSSHVSISYAVFCLK